VAIRYNQARTDDRHCVTVARIDGDIRVCQMADGQEVHEKISEVSAERRSYRFEHLRVRCRSGAPAAPLP